MGSRWDQTYSLKVAQTLLGEWGDRSGQFPAHCSPATGGLSSAPVGRSARALCPPEPTLLGMCVFSLKQVNTRIAD